MEKEIFIRKEAGKKKSAIRVTREEDIPEELRGAIRIVDGMLELDCVEGVWTIIFIFIIKRIYYFL